MFQNWTPAYLSKLPLTILSWASGLLAVSHCLQVPIYNTLGHISMALHMLLKEKSPPPPLHTCLDSTAPHFQDTSFNDSKPPQSFPKRDSSSVLYAIFASSDIEGIWYTQFFFL